MKFIITQITAAVLTATIASATIILPRQEVSDNSTLSSYPAGTDINILNGTWYLTGISQNAWNYYQTFSNAMNIQIGCLKFNITPTSNTTLDILASAFLTHQGSEAGVNASAAGVAFLQQPDSNVNVTDHQLEWNAYGSQAFVNVNAWNNFTSNGQNQHDTSGDESTIIPGTKPFQITLYSKLIDSNASSEANVSNIDTVFLWASQVKFYDPSQFKKREPQDTVYGAIFSKTTNVTEATFNKTLTFLPQQAVSQNITLVQLNDTCH